MNSSVLVAACENYREDVDQPCTGTLRYRWGMVEAACDTCGGYCGVAVAKWRWVEQEQPQSITNGYRARPVVCGGVHDGDGCDCPPVGDR